MPTNAERLAMHAAIAEIRGTDYTNGYHNGRADKLLGHRSLVAATSEREMYKLGYRDGQLDGSTLQ